MIYKPHKLGKLAEIHVCNYLKNKGLTLIERNYRCVLGEIDLIMKEQNTIVFIEVRFRNKNIYATGLESVTATKRKKIIKTASHYLQKNNLYNRKSCRFDVVGVSYKEKRFEFDWVKEAFQQVFFL